MSPTFHTASTVDNTVEVHITGFVVFRNGEKKNGANPMQSHLKHACTPNFTPEKKSMILLRVLPTLFQTHEICTPS